MNKGRLDRTTISKQYGFSIPQLTKAYWNWQEVFRIEGSTLTYKQYLDKLAGLNLTPNDVGNKKHQYNLSRYGDKGPYTDENCRFITREENELEQEHPVKEKPIYQCEYCNKPFFGYNGPNRKSRFCSRFCMGSFQYPKGVKVGSK